MEIIFNALDNVSKVLSLQDFQSDKEYRPITFQKSIFIDNNYVLYNSLTREILLLSCEEYNNFLSGRADDYLIKHWFLVPKDIDDSTLLYMFNKAFQSRFPRSRYGKFELCTIITTTDCNARCPYCYQKGIERKFMSDQVALDVAKFIVPRSSDYITLNWFGGEPLYNSNAIDIICNYFNINKIGFRSTMISNGFLFNKFSIQKLRELWRLQRVQITLDGTTETYNRTKKYIYNNANPFKIVIDNIEFLSSNGIFVDIRLNLSPDNIDDMFLLVKWLSERYPDKKNIGVYSRVLFDNTISDMTQEQRSKIYSRHLQLQDYIKSYHLSNNLNKPPSVKRCHCMADDGRSVVINTEGDLSLCEHFIDSEAYGSIYGGEIHREILEKFSKRQNEITECKTCYYRPLCFRLEMCKPEGVCDEETRKINDYQTITMMKNMYNQYVQRRGKQS